MGNFPNFPRLFTFRCSPCGVPRGGHPQIGNNWWERSVNPNNSNNFLNVNTNGDPSNNNNATNSNCVCPDFLHLV